MTTAQLATYIGQEFFLNQNGLGVKVLIVDAKHAYGNLRFKVEAKDGDGSKVWIDASRVKQ